MSNTGPNQNNLISDYHGSIQYSIDNVSEDKEDRNIKLKNWYYSIYIDILIRHYIDQTPSLKQESIAICPPFQSKYFGLESGIVRVDLPLKDLIKFPRY